MRRSRRESRSSRGSPMVRLGSMIVLLFLLYALIQQARDPHTLDIFVKDTPSTPAVATDPGPAAGHAEGSPGQAAAAGNQGIDPVVPRDPDGAKTAQPTAVEDEQERQRTKELLDLVTDRTLLIQKREMPAYWRLITKTRELPFEALRKQARRDLVFNDFYSSPRKHRGELVQLELNVRRVVTIEWGEENPAGVQRLYELWGVTNESKVWPYMVLTSELPPGMPQQGEVEFRATVVGYFFKVQAYEAVGAKPNAKPLAAPLVIGRLDWQPPAPRQVATDPTWLWIVAGVLVLVAAVLIGIRILPSKRGRRSPPGAGGDQNPDVPEWLSQSTRGPSEPQGEGDPSGGFTAGLDGNPPKS